MIDGPERAGIRRAPALHQAAERQPTTEDAVPAALIHGDQLGDVTIDAAETGVNTASKGR